ncbi:MAG: alkyl sulfatase dimerization domain-containing protein, partial [Alphaproteobacteria bacterium]
DPLIDVTTHPRATKAMQARTKRQFGIGLSYPDEIIGIGVGPGDRPLQGMGAGMMAPTRLISEERTAVTLSGVDLELVMAPGETPDHMVVWYPARKILFSGDNFYRSFPNLYAIRGTAYRDFDVWADTMDLLMAFNADVLGPGHTRPLFGTETIRDALSDYRDAIRHVVTETRDGMDAGLTFDQLAHSVKLPPELAEKPHLREYYGSVAYAVRAYFVGTMGWFDGNPTSLNPLSPKDEAERMIRLAGGAGSVWREIEAARGSGEYQWALQLLDRLIHADEDADRARAAKAAVLRDHAVSQINCPTRHYYIQSAKELEQQSDRADG